MCCYYCPDVKDLTYKYFPPCYFICILYRHDRVDVISFSFCLVRFNNMVGCCSKLMPESSETIITLSSNRKLQFTNGKNKIY